MSENPYAAPQSDLTHPGTHANNAAFYVVSIKKFLTLYIATLGAYQLYWFYRNWSLYRDKYKEKIWPVPRAVFSIFFVHALFRYVRATIDREGKRIDWDPRSNATMLVVLIILSNMLNRASMRLDSEWFVDLASTIILAPSAYVFFKAQVAVNLSCGDPEGSHNGEFTTANFLWIGLGGLLWIAVIAGLFVK